MLAREFDPGSTTTRVRVEEAKQYKIRFHITSTNNANQNAQLRLRGRAVKFYWSQKLEVGGAFGAGSENNVIAQQSLPGIGAQNPDKNSSENGGWYTMVVHSPMSTDIRPDVAGTLADRMPRITAQPGPGTAASSARDLRFGFDLIDTLSGMASSREESGEFTVDRVVMRSYDVVPD